MATVTTINKPARDFMNRMFEIGVITEPPCWKSYDEVEVKLTAPVREIKMEIEIDFKEF